MCVCGSLRVYFTNLVRKHVNQPFYITSGVARFSFRPPTEIMSFLLYFTYNFAVFHRIILQDKLHSFNIQDDQSPRASDAQQIIK